MGYLKEQWYLLRADTNGVEYLVDTYDDEKTANDIAAEFNAKPHHQTYWVSNTLPDNVMR